MTSSISPARPPGGPAAAPVTPWLIASLAALSALPPLSVDMHLPVFPLLAGELDASAASVQMTLSAYMVGLVIGQLVIGPLSDRHGRRRLLVFGMALSAAATAACALAGSIEVLILLRLVQGIACAAGVVLSGAIVSDVADGVRGARLFGVLMLIQGIAPAAAPILGSFIGAAWGWRSVFWTLTALNTLLLVPYQAMFARLMTFRSRALVVWRLRQVM
jgi:MFS transporter, DHA1 family, multidrug resistance protein